MKVKSGYKQTDVGVIPEQWEVKTLGSLSSLLTNGFVGTATSAYVESQDGVLYIQGYNVQENGFDFHGIKRVSKSFHARNQKSCLQSGDLLTIQTGDIGVTAVVPSELAGANCHALIISRLKRRDSEPGYYCQYFNSERGRVAFKEIETGSTMKHLNCGDMRRLLLPSPPIEEQRAIATALNDLDALLGVLEQLIAKKRDLKQAAMQQLLTGKTRLTGFHGEWAVKTLGDLFTFSGGFWASRDQLSKEGHCYLHYGDIHGSSKSFVDTRADYPDIPKLNIPLKQVSPRSLLDDGDIVFVDASEDDEGTSKHVVVMNKENVPFIAGLHTIVAKSKTDELAHEYRRYCFQTAAIQRQFLFYAVGTKATGISKTNITKLTLTFPKVPEQLAIAEVLSDVDTELAGLERRREKTRALKQAMMQELLSGQTRLV
jgi:type I restriction enzyme S subunit